MAKEPNDKIVPTLVDVIIPGTTDTESQESVVPPPADPIPKTPLSQLDLEKKIELQVSKILIRHMEEIRKDVIRRVLTEVRAHLDSDKK
jgi:hypothetical protein